MVREFKEGMFRLGLGLTLLFLFLGLYMRSYYVGAFYQTIDGYLTALPIARLAFMLMAAAALISLARPLSEVVVGAMPLLNPRLGWSGEDAGPRIYKGFIYMLVFVALYISGYLMVAPALSEAFSPLQSHGWVTLAFGLIWLVVGLGVLAGFARRCKPEYLMLRSWRAERKAIRVEARVAAKNAMPETSQAGSLPAVKPGVEVGASQQAGGKGGPARRFCKECGSKPKEGAAFCGECGESLR